MSTAIIIASVASAFIAGLTLERWRARSRLRSSEAQRYAALACSSLQVLFWELDRQSGKMTWLSDSLDVLGGQVPTLACLRSLVVSEDLRAFDANLSAGRTPAKGLELRINHVARGERWLLVHFQSAASAAAPGLLAGLCLDIDAAKRATQELLRQRADYHAIFDSSPALIWFKDRSNGIVRANRAAAKSIGRSVEQLEGRQTEEFYPEQAARYLADDLAVICGGGPRLGIIEPQTLPNGETLWMRTDKIPYRDEQGEIAGVIAFALDITEQKRAEERLVKALDTAERATNAKSEFLSAMSHEIRTPLGVMMGFSELLTAPNLDSKTRVTYAEKVLRNGRRLMKLVDEILDLSKVERGQLQLEMVGLSLKSLLADVSSLLSQKARVKGIGFEIHTHGEIPEQVVSDASRIRQILINVVDNAIKFTEMGGVRVSVSSQRTPPLGPSTSLMLDVIVTDTGIGISDEGRTRLFQPFEQSDATMARRYGGSGLGLSLSRQLARALGGDIILVSSAPDQGSTFSVTLQVAVESSAVATFTYQMPSTAVDAAGPLALHNLAASSPPALGAWAHVTLLLVEDNPDIQDMIRMYLNDTGATLAVASNGQEGLQLAFSTPGPDLILMDLQLPGVDGMRATAKLRASNFRPPVIAMTAHAMMGQRQICLDAGFDDFLTKPFSKKDLLRTLARFVT